MSNSLKATATGAMIVALTALGGCANTAEMEALRSDVNKANASAARAAADAAAAQRDAAAARQAAEQASANSQATSEKLDRMFKKSMQK